jgi:hypothetical protein
MKRLESRKLPRNRVAVITVVAARSGFLRSASGATVDITHSSCGTPFVGLVDE